MGPTCEEAEDPPWAFFALIQRWPILVTFFFLDLGNALGQGKTESLREKTPARSSVDMEEEALDPHLQADRQGDWSF